MGPLVDAATEDSLRRLATRVDEARATLDRLGEELRGVLASSNVRRGDLLDHDEDLHDLVAGALADSGSCPECMTAAEERVCCACGYDEPRGA